MQICTVQGSKSDLNYKSCGVPQGSNLGSFSLYINDLLDILEQTHAPMFADITSISSSSTS